MLTASQAKAIAQTHNLKVEALKKKMKGILDQIEAESRKGKFSYQVYINDEEVISEFKNLGYKYEKSISHNTGCYGENQYTYSLRW